MAEQFWSGFRLDPRRPEHARIRATDADREHARDLFAEAYADGRLGRDELDVRSAKVAAPIALGTLLHLVSDLEPVRTVPTGSGPTGGGPGPGRELLVFVVCSAACVLLWALTGRGFFWPLWVIVYTGLLPLATVVSRARSWGRSQDRKGHNR